MNPFHVLAAFVLTSTALVVLPTAAQAAPATCHGRAATIVGTPERDRLVGTAGADVIVARGGDDVVRGRGGDDLVCGGEGADHLLGGAGDDRLYGQTEAFLNDRGGRYFISDILDGGFGDDLLDVGGDGRDVDWGNHGALDFSAAPRGIEVDLAAGTATGLGSDTVVDRGEPSCDYECFGIVVLATDGADELVGGPHNDGIYGFAGDDVIDGQGGNDTLRAESEADPRQDVPDDDTVAGGPGRDSLISFVGADVLRGDGGADEIYAAGSGPSEAYGGAGDDQLTVGFPTRPAFVVDGGDGQDNATVESPRRAGAGGRPEAVTWDGGTGQVTDGDTLWGSITAVEDLLLVGGVDWTCESTGGVEVRGCG